MLNKVYCKKCKHCFDAANNDGGYPEYMCKASGEQYDSYLERRIRYSSCDDLNSNNDCINYKRSFTLYRIIQHLTINIKKILY